MAKDKTAISDKKQEKSKFNLKIILIGIPLFIIQLIAVYFITANFLLEKWKQSNLQVSNNNQVEQISENKSSNTTSESELGKYVYLAEDVIVNPANTQGKRLLLASIGFDLKSEENKTAMKEKEIPVRDMIISTLASKTIEQLNSVTFKDSLKNEISQNVVNIIPGLKINHVYFSKYIIQ